MFFPRRGSHIYEEREEKTTNRRNEGTYLGKKPLVSYLIRPHHLRRGYGFPRATPSSLQTVPESRRRAEAAPGRRARRAQREDATPLSNTVGRY
jgi:hypothetical protein